jgi:hypothetical protein
MNVDYKPLSSASRIHFGWRCAPSRVKFNLSYGDAAPLPLQHKSEVRLLVIWRKTHWTQKRTGPITTCHMRHVILVPWIGAGWAALKHHDPGKFSLKTQFSPSPATHYKNLGESGLQVKIWPSASYSAWGNNTAILVILKSVLHNTTSAA